MKSNKYFHILFPVTQYQFQCAKEVGQNWSPIDHCVNSVEGQKALHDVAVKQESLNPKLTFVPWILVNDVSIPYIYIYREYRGTLLNSCGGNR